MRCPCPSASSRPTESKRAGRGSGSRASVQLVHAAQATSGRKTDRTRMMMMSFICSCTGARGEARGEGDEAVRGFAGAWCQKLPSVYRAWYAGRHAWLCEPVVPGRPSRVAAAASERAGRLGAAGDRAVLVCGGLRRCPCARAPRFPCAPVAATPLDRFATPGGSQSHARACPPALSSRGARD